MTETPVHKLILSLSVPTILSMMVTSAYNMVDTAFVGRLGNSASGAVGVVFGYMAIIQACGFMFGQGSGSLMSRYLGAREKELADRAASTGFFSCFSVGIILAVLSAVFLDPLIMLLGSTETIAPYAKDYISCLIFTVPFATSSFTLNNLLRYEGRASLGMIGLIAGAFLNIAGDAIFMFGLNMGIRGAGLATALSQVISFSILASMFVRGRTQCHLSPRKITLGGRMLSDIILTGFPSMLRQALGSLATIVQNFMAAAYAGDEAVAGMSIVSRVGFFLFAIALGIGQGFQPVCAFNYGAGKYKRVRKAYRFTLQASEAVLLVLTVIAMIFSNDIIGIFRDDADVIRIGTRALRLLCVAQIFLPLCMVTEMLMQCSGRKLMASFLSSLRGGILFIPALLILPRFRGLAGVQEAQPLAYILSVVPALIAARKFFLSIPAEDRDVSAP